MAETLKLITQEQSWLNEVQADVVERLRTLLEKAEAGEIQGFAFAGLSVDGMTITCATKNDNQAMLIGAIERVKYRMLASED